MLLFLASFTRIAGPTKDSQNNSRADPSLMVDRERARVINWSGQETEKARHLLIMIGMDQMMFRDFETYLRLLCCPPTSLHLQSISALAPDSHRSDDHWVTGHSELMIMITDHSQLTQITLSLLTCSDVLRSGAPCYYTGCGE